MSYTPNLEMLSHLKNQQTFFGHVFVKTIVRSKLIKTKTNVTLFIMFVCCIGTKKNRIITNNGILYWTGIKLCNEIKFKKTDILIFKCTQLLAIIHFYCNCNVIEIIFFSSTISLTLSTVRVHRACSFLTAYNSGRRYMFC